jgi:hypothetical protein
MSVLFNFLPSVKQHKDTQACVVGGMHHLILWCEKMALIDAQCDAKKNQTSTKVITQEL